MIDSDTQTLLQDIQTTYLAKELPQPGKIVRQQVEATNYATMSLTDLNERSREAVYSSSEEESSSLSWW